MHVCIWPLNSNFTSESGTSRIKEIRRKHKTLVELDLVEAFGGDEDDYKDNNSTYKWSLNVFELFHILVCLLLIL